MSEREVFRRAIEQYGKPAQMMMVAEECGELLKECSKYLRKGNHYDKTKLMEEVVDVQIMLDQIKVMCDYDDFQLDILRKEKVGRLMKRLF
jgi:dimeric dUTPase (all-alpha-NTP-PPase superfamily)